MMLLYKTIQSSKFIAEDCKLHPPLKSWWASPAYCQSPANHQKGGFLALFRQKGLHWDTNLKVKKEIIHFLHISAPSSWISHCAFRWNAQHHRPPDMEDGALDWQITGNVRNGGGIHLVRNSVIATSSSQLQ